MSDQRKTRIQRREEHHYREALSTQLGFIQRSCEIFDRGERDEAIRIATQLRVILNPGGGSKKSLLQHLGVHKRIKLLSTCPGVSSNASPFQGMGSFRYESDGINTSRVFYAPLENAPVAYEMKLREWWNQIVYVLPSTSPAEPNPVLRRRDIILSAVNKDGGAHFDAVLPLEYEQLAAPGAVNGWVTELDGVEHTTPTVGAHFVCLRQMGYEVLHSPGLFALMPTQQDSEGRQKAV